MVSVKKDIRDRELWDADVKIEDERVINADTNSKVEKDAFFASSSDEDDGITSKQIEKRPVMRDGRVPKLAKNFEKMQEQKILKQRKAEGWYDDPVPEAKIEKAVPKI